MTRESRFLSPTSKIGPLGPANQGPICSFQFGTITGRGHGARRGCYTPRRSTLLARAFFSFTQMTPEDTTPRIVTTVLLPVQVGEKWRVQIVWPNGSVHYFGNFGRRQDAADWITAHAWLMAVPKPSRTMPRDDEH
jgi:hypothetical protein